MKKEGVGDEEEIQKETGQEFMNKHLLGKRKGLSFSTNLWMWMRMCGCGYRRSQQFYNFNV